MTKNIQKIEDIVGNLHEILSELREMPQEDTFDCFQDIEAYISDYFSRPNIDELELKKMLVSFVDELYIKTMEMPQRDVFTDLYFCNIISHLFLQFEKKQIFAFFILDNELRDDRFKLAFELFGDAGFSTIAPYSFDSLEHSDEYTTLPTLEYKKLEKQIDKAKADARHIFYLEKDDSVDHLTKVLAIAEEFQSEYVCIFRNESIEIDKTANWLMGNFSETIITDQPSHKN
jgi:hypothetical protein